MRELEFRQAINEALVQEMERDERVYVFGRTLPSTVGSSASHRACSTGLVPRG